MTPLTYKRCVYPETCLLLSLVYKHPYLLTHTNENFRKQYELSVRFHTTTVSESGSGKFTSGNYLYLSHLTY